MDNPRRQLYLAGILIIVFLTAAAYIPAFHAGYIWDDSDHVTQVPFQRTFTVLKWIWFKLGTTPQYYPLTHTTFWLEYRLWGMNPAGYHAVNVVLHIACALLLWRVLSRLQIGGAWLIAAIFAVHPVNVESVAWITERKNTLSALFYLLAMLLAIRAWRIGALLPQPHSALQNPGGAGLSQPGRGEAPSSSPRHGNAPMDDAHHPKYSTDVLRYILCLLFFILAVLSKTVTCTFPAALVLILWWKQARLSRRDILLLLPFFAIALAAAKLTSGMEQWNVGAVGPEFVFSFAQRVLIAGRAVWFYAGKLLFPYPLIFIYPRWNIEVHSAWQWLFPAAAVIAIAALWFLRKRMGRGPLAAVLFFVGTLFPALGFVNVYPMRFSFVADHFQYLAGIGILILVVQLLRKIPLPKPAIAPAAMALLVVLGVLSYLQCRPYANATTLWRDTLAKNPTCWLAMDNLGAEASLHGDRDAAMDWYARSLAIHPNQAEAHLSRGQLFETAQPPRLAEARREFDAAATIKPNDAGPIHELAKLSAAEGKLPEAMAEYEQALALEPRLEPARMEYARLLNMAGQGPQAEAQYRKALEINPDSTDARSALAGIAYMAGDMPDALRLMQEATDINPTDPVLANNYGVFLMRTGQAAEAREQFESAIAADPTFADAYDGLGNAMAALGDKAGAAGMFRKAMELKPDFKAARQHLKGLGGG
jgi:Tfp pilus assembly protein PilF